MSNVSFVTSQPLSNVVLISEVRLRETLLLVPRDHLCWVSCGGDVVWVSYYLIPPPPPFEVHAY